MYMRASSTRIRRKRPAMRWTHGGMPHIHCRSDLSDEKVSIQLPKYEKGKGKMSRLRGKGKHTVIIIITDNHLLNLPELAHLAPEILIEGIEVILQLASVHFDFWVVGWVLVEVGEKDGLRVWGLDVLAWTAVAVTAGADFVVERTIDFVGFSAKDAGEVVGHFWCSWWCLWSSRMINGSSTFGIASW